MHEFEYPQKLILTKIEEDESPVVWRQHTHYFKICNEEGEVIDDSDWYQIENGELSVEVRNLSFSTILHSLDRDNEEVDEGSDYEGSQTRETLRGQGRLVRGSTRDPIDGYDVCLSHFGNDNRHKDIRVLFMVIEEDIREYFQLVGIKAIFEPGLHLEESFDLTFFLHKETFNTLRKTIADTDPDHIDVTLDLEFFPGLYTKYSWALGNEYGVIKQVYGTSQILNIDDFQEEFLEEILDDTYSSRGHKFNIVVSKEFAGGASDTTSHIDDDYEGDEHHYSASQSEITNALIRELRDAQEVTNKRLTLFTTIGSVIAGLLLASLW